MYYEDNFIERSRKEVMQHLLDGDNVSIIFHKREELNINWSHIFLSKNISEHGITSSKTTNYQCPLYLYPDNEQIETGEYEKRRPNLNMEIVNTIAEKLKMSFVEESTTNSSGCGEPTPNPSSTESTPNPSTGGELDCDNTNSPSFKKGAGGSFPSMKGQGVVDSFDIRDNIIYKNKIIDLPYNPKLKERARELRKAGNLSEVLFWQQVHKKKFLEY